MNIIYNKINPRLRNVQNPDLKAMTEPFLFVDGDQKMYIIQNVSYYYPERVYVPALQIARYWRENEVNPGTSYFEHDDVPLVKNELFVIYILNSDGELVVYNDQSKGHEQYLQIIQYGDNRFAAMLPIS